MPSIRLSPSAVVTPTNAGVLLRSDLGSFQLSGPDGGVFVAQIVRLLDGTRDREAVVQALPSYSPTSVATFLDGLAAHGLLDEGSTEPGRWRGQAAFFQRWPEASASAMERLAQARVVVAGSTRWAQTAAEELSAAGVGAVVRLEGVQDGDGAASLGNPTLLLAAAPAGDVPWRERVARVAHRARVMTLWSQVTRAGLVVGPWVVPGETACRVCVDVDALNPPLASVRAMSLAAAQLLGHLTAMEALKLLTRYTPSTLAGRVMVFDADALQSSYHTLVRLPWCRVCGVPAGG